MRPYGLSKRLGEDLCEGFTRRTGIATVCLRPVAVWDQARYGQIRDQWRTRPRSEWEPYWEYGAFVDVRDVAAAVGQALTVPLEGHHRVLLCAAGIAATAPSLDLAARLAPARAGHRPRPLPRRSLGRPHRLLRRRHHAQLAAHPPVVTSAEPDTAITLPAAEADGFQRGCTVPAWVPCRQNERW